MLRLLHIPVLRHMNAMHMSRACDTAGPVNDDT